MNKCKNELTVSGRKLSEIILDRRYIQTLNEFEREKEKQNSVNNIKQIEKKKETNVT